MCGIAGLFRGPNEPALHAMLHSLKHRGPNHTGNYSDENISVGMVRLSILDVSSDANQPMFSESKDVILVYNGEMYNFLEEREKLSKLGYTFYTQSDTEVVLNMYLEYGQDFLNRIRGIFALAIYDKRDEDDPKLLLARDPFGIKPLLYYQNHGVILFASELKAMLNSKCVEKELDVESLRLLFTYGSVKQPRTMISGVNMLLPGCMLFTSVKSSEVTISKYCEDLFEPDDHIGKLSYNEQKEIVYQTLVESVKSQLVSDVPLGAFLSGGIDSSLIVSIMTKVEGRNVKTFSVGFEAEGHSIDETDDAALIAKHLDTDHQRVVVTGSDFRNDFFKIINSLDQPSVDGVNSYFVSKAAAGDVTVALSGTGGDELFTGYPWFIHMLQYDIKHSMSPLNGLKKMLLKSTSFNKAANSEFEISKYFNHFRSDLSFLSKFSREYLINNTSKVKRLFNDSVNDRIQYPLDIAMDYRDIDNESTNSVINRVSVLAINGYLRNQLLRDIDVMSMTHSLEVRVPFIDTEVLKVALSLSETSKISKNRIWNDPKTQTYRDLGAKRVLIDIGKEFLTEDYDKQPKRGFGMPFQDWMIHHCSDFIDEVFNEETIKKRGIFDNDHLQKLHRQFKSGTFNWSEIWLIVVFEYWCRDYID